MEMDMLMIEDDQLSRSRSLDSRRQQSCFSVAHLSQMGDPTLAHGHGHREPHRQRVSVPTTRGHRRQALRPIDCTLDNTLNVDEHMLMNTGLRKSLSNYVLGIQEEKAMAAVPQLPIERAKFIQFVHERRKKKILFKGEYLMIKRSADSSCHSTDAGSSSDVADRNQYPEILPYDHNRVVLPRIPDHPVHSEYVNASYIHGVHGRGQYVVTQSIKNKAMISEFWRTVWFLRSNCIVMLTKVFDFMRVMCLQYWPVQKTEYGDLDVETLETRSYCHYVIRVLRISRGSESRIVTQFHFNEWELDSFPYISAFLEFRRRVKQFINLHPVDAPLIVHCSNGAGRSGVYVAVDSCLDQLAETGSIDVFSFCKRLNNERMGLIESVEQYTFIYDVLCEAVECPVEPSTLQAFDTRSAMYKTKLSRETMEKQDTDQYKILNKLTPSLSVGDCAGGHRIENRGKNRDVMVVPPDHARPYLNTLHGESKDYTFINAVCMDGFHRKQEWIATEWPKPLTIDSFWALIFDHSCHTVVNLSNQGKPKTYPKFIHDRGKQVYGPFVVEVLNCQSYPSMTSHTVKVMKRKTSDNMQVLLKRHKDEDPSHANLASAMGIPIRKDAQGASTSNSAETVKISEIMASSGAGGSADDYRICCVVSVRMWPIQNKVPLSTSGLVDVIKMVRSWRKRAPDRPETKPTVVMSHNGVSRVGIFVAANYCIDQMDADAEVDVFHAVKMIRINRPQVIDSKDEFKYLYDLMLHWYVMNPDYRRSVAQGNAEQNHV